jgi:hypothetical protein
MQVLIGTLLAIVAVCLGGLYGIQTYGVEWLKGFSSLETVVGVTIVGLLFLRALLRSVAHLFVVYREEVAAKRLASNFRPHMSQKDLEAKLIQLVQGGFSLPKRSLLGQRLDEAVQCVGNEKRAASRAMFNRDEFVGFYRHSLGEGRRALEESRTLLMSLCVVATLAGLVMAMGAGKAGTAEEMQATTLQTFAFMRAAMAVSVTGLFGAAVLYLIGAKTRVWEGRVVATVRKVAGLGLSPCLNMAAYPAVLLQELAPDAQPEAEPQAGPVGAIPSRGWLNGAGAKVHPLAEVTP